MIVFLHELLGGYASCIALSLGTEGTLVFLIHIFVVNVLSLDHHLSLFLCFG